MPRASRKTPWPPIGRTIGTPTLDELVPEVLHLADASPDVVVRRHHLADAEGQRLHVAAGHPPIGVQPLEGDQQSAGALGQLGVAQGEEAPDVDQVVLLRRDRGAVAQVADLAQDLGHAAVRVARAPAA